MQQEERAALVAALERHQAAMADLTTACAARDAAISACLTSGSLGLAALQAACSISRQSIYAAHKRHQLHARPRLPLTGEGERQRRMTALDDVAARG